MGCLAEPQIPAPRRFAVPLLLETTSPPTGHFGTRRVGKPVPARAHPLPDPPSPKEDTEPTRPRPHNEPCRASASASTRPVCAPAAPGAVRVSATTPERAPLVAPSLTSCGALLRTRRGSSMAPCFVKRGADRFLSFTGCCKVDTGAGCGGGRCTRQGIRGARSALCGRAPRSFVGP